MIAKESRNIAAAAVGALLALLAVLAAIAIAPDSAAAQSAFCQQYPNDPSCLGDVGPGGGTGSHDPQGTGPGFGPGTAGGTGTGTGDGSGELPFTGYPLTPLLLLLLILLLTGITVRTYLAIRDRARGRDALADPALT